MSPTGIPSFKMWCLDGLHLPVSVYLLMTAHLLPQTAHHFSTSTPTLLNIIISCSFSIHTFPVFLIVEPLCLWNMVTVTSLKNDIIVAKRHTPRIKKTALSHILDHFLHLTYSCMLPSLPCPWSSEQLACGRQFKVQKFISLHGMGENS